MPPKQSSPFKIQIDKLIKNKNYVNDLNSTELEDLLYYINDLYYNSKNGSPISDELFDYLKDTLKEKNQNSPFLKQIGAPILNLDQRPDKVNLPYFMGSLDKIKPEKDTLDDWKAKYKGPYVISDKLDGVSGLIYKKDGNLSLYTRGDGLIGQNITHLLKYVIDKKVKLDELPDGYAVRGELIITKKGFEKIKDEMANARNAVSGLVNSKPKSINKNVLAVTKFVTYAILYPEMKQEEQMKELEKYNFDIASYQIEKKITIDSLGELLVERKKKSEFEIDGLVVIDSLKAYKVESGENPKYGFAYKQILEGQTIETTVVQVIWQASMDGYLKPKIEIKPVSLGGTTITYATAFNARYVVDNVIGKGAKIILVRSGDVIPHILEVIKPSTSGKPDLPDVLYKWNDTDIDIILNDVHSDAYKNVNVRKITHFFKTLGVMYISEGIIAKLVENGYDDVFKILNANDKKIIEIDGIGEKLWNKINTSIEEKMSSTNLSTLMSASRCFERGMGEKKFQLIFDKYHDFMKNNWKEDEFIKKITDVEGFDSKTAIKIAKNFDAFKKYFDKLNNLFDLKYLLKKKDVVKGTNFASQIIVFTGFRDKDLEKQIVEGGGKVSTSVSGNTTLVVYVDTNSSKYQEAIKKGIKTISKDNFMKLFI
jgi:DNA ligase (NAD+)